MGLRANNKGGDDFEIMPEDTHIAVCYGVIDLGTQRGEYKGQEKINEKFMLMFETPENRVEWEGEDKPMVISKEYTKSTGTKSNLYKDLTSWRGKALTPDESQDFDLTKLVGVACQLQVIHKTSAKGNKYPYINSIIKLPSNMTAPKAEHEYFIYELTEDYIPEEIPDWIKDKIKASLEWTGEKPFDGAPEEVSDVEPF